MTADQLLSQRWLFKKGDDIEALRKALLKKWHPDKTTDPLASKVSALVLEQYKSAKKGEFLNVLTILTKKGELSYPYLAKRVFELGELFICPRHLIWATRRENDDLAKRWLETAKSYKFPNDEVRDKITPYIPRNSHTVANGDWAYTIVDRPLDYIRLADIIAARGPLDPKVVAWTLSRAYNIAGFLNYNKIVHLDLTPESFFIDPESHHGALLGGWFYTGTPKPLAAPARTAHFAKPEHVRSHLAQQIRVMGRRCFGVTSHYEMRRAKQVPEPMQQFLLASGTNDLLKDQKGWRDAIVEAFGPRKFTVYDLKAEEIYSS